MNEKELSGYTGEALKTIKNAQVKVGDNLQIIKNGQLYEGILIPRSGYSAENHIVIKLKNGYNIGVRITPNIRIEKKGKGLKPSFTPSPSPEQDPQLSRVAIISTGGTIASRVDYRTGAVRSALTASDLYSVVPELSKIARIEAKILFSLYSENITSKHWTEIAKSVAKQINEGVNGVVVTHGTDTMGYTAAALSFALQNLPVPVILVGSQRSSDRPSSDAATNLIGSVKAASEAPFAEVAIAMHDTISDKTIALHRGTKVRKCHTSKRDAFKSVNSSVLARIDDQKITMTLKDFKNRNSSRKLLLQPEFEEKVELIKFYPGLNPKIIDWCVDKKYKGMILEGTGLGHVSTRCFQAIKNAVKNDVIVAMTSQCIWGRINMNVYDQGRDLLALGIIPLEDMLSETATVKLMWILGQTKSIKEAKKLLKTNIAGEISLRILPENK
jgi:glutamyl-tRNA(Gln) amidotransferase subunit D